MKRPRFEAGTHLLRALCLCAVTLTLAGNAAAQQGYAHRDIRTGKVTVHSVVILPPLVTLTKEGFKASDEQVEAAQKLADGLPDVVRAVLEEIGYVVSIFPSGSSAPEDNPDAKYSLADVQTQFNALNKEMDRKPWDVGKGRFSLGDAVEKIGRGESADVFVFVRGVGRVTTTGKEMVGLASGGLVGLATEGSFLHMDIAAVDARTGTVLYYGVVDYDGDMFLDQRNVLLGPVSQALEHFHGPKWHRPKT